MALTVSVDEIVHGSRNPLLGVRPQWKRIRLREIASVLNGFAFKSGQFAKGDGMPLIRIRDVGSDSTDTNYVGEFDERYLIEPGDLLVGMDGDFNCARWRGPRGLLNQRVCKVTLRTDQYHPRFLDFALPGYLRAINDATSSVTVKHLSSRTIEDIPLPFPPLHEQEEIVAELDKQFSRLDEAAANLKRVKANLVRYEMAVLRAMIVGESNQHFDRSTLPSGRELIPLSELGELSRGKSKHRPRDDPRLYGGPYPFVQTGDVRRSDGVVREYTQTYSELGLSQSRLWPAGTLCITIAANIAETGILAMPACFPDSVVGFLSQDPVLTRFVELFMRTARGELEQFAPATAQKNINLAVLERVMVPLPPAPERERIVAEVDRRLSIIRDVAAVLETNLTRTRTLRQALLEQNFGTPDVSSIGRRSS